MENTKHTLGPWSYRNNSEDFSIESDKKTVAYARVSDHWDDFPLTDEESEANAKLIASAPDLLECLIAMVGEYEKTGGNSLNYRNAKLTIKQATEL